MIKSRRSKPILPKAFIMILLIALVLCLPSQSSDDIGAYRTLSIDQNFPVGSSTNITLDLVQASFSNMVINEKYILLAYI